MEILHFCKTEMQKCTNFRNTVYIPGKWEQGEHSPKTTMPCGLAPFPLASARSGNTARRTP